MMAKKVKSLRDIIAKDEKSAGRNIPKGEADFLAKHEVEKTEDANGNGDDVFNAKKVKPEEKSQIDAGKRHGYRGDEDVAAYEETIHEKGMECNKSSAKIYCPVHGKEECSGDVEEELTPKQKMLDKNKNGKLDGDDFKKLRKESKDEREYDYEGDMAISQIKSIMNHSKQLMDMLKPDTNLPEWVQSKITLSKDYIQTAADYMSTEMKEEADLNELSKNTLGQYASKSLRRGEIANRMSKSDNDEMGKIANKRLSGVNTAVDKMAVKTGRKSIATSIKKDVKKTKASGDAYTSGTGTDDHGKSYYKAMNNIGKMREEVVDEAMGYTTQKERAKQALAAYYAKKRGEQ
jgi:uncharacterized Zn finger protein (UPF0148 family)